GREPQRPRRPCPWQRWEGADRSLQPIDGSGDQGVAERSGSDRCRGWLLGAGCSKKGEDLTTHDRAVVSQLPGRPVIDAKRRQVGKKVCRGVQHTVWDQPACAATFVR